MRCGKCGSEQFEVALGTTHCVSCGAYVDAVVAAAVHAGLAPPPGDPPRRQRLRSSPLVGMPAGYVFPDLSHYRTVCDWRTFSNAYPVAACKATEGATGKDRSFPTWLANMRRFSCFPIAYHFLRTETTIAAQVANYLAALDGGPVGYMLDVETSGAGTNPTIAQADAWFDELARRTKRSRGTFLNYMPRWWWQAHGGASIATRDTILHNSHFSSKPFIGSFAGSQVQVIQFSSTASIMGACAPGTGDQNIAIGRNAAQLTSLLTKGGATPGDDHMSATDVAQLKQYIDAQIGELRIALKNDVEAIAEAHDDPGFFRAVDEGYKEGWPVYHTNFLGRMNLVANGDPLDTFVVNTKRMAKENAKAVRVAPAVLDQLWSLAHGGEARNRKHLEVK